MSTFAVVVLDGVDITDWCIEGSVTKRLNGVSEATIKVHMTAPFEFWGSALPGPGSYLKIYFFTDLDSTPVLYHHGRVMVCETTADENVGYTQFNSSDPLELWGHRPVRDPPDTSGKYGTPGNFSKPSILEDFLYAPRIVQAMMDGSELNAIPADSEGPLRLARGAVAVGTADVSGAPADWPMTMAQLASLLLSTGQLDIVITPIEFDGDMNYGQVDLYNGDFGTDHTGDVLFQYGMGLRNIRALRWNQDMTSLCNKLWYYLGPKCDDEHWRANITGSDPGLADPPQTTVIARRDASRIAYDVRMDIQIFDGAGDGSGPCAEAVVVGHELYRRLWQVEQYLRAIPRTLVHVTPTRDTGIGEFDIGDLITVEATADVMGGFTGAQRVYSYTISWDQDSVPALSELQVSSDQEGFLS